MKSFSTSTWTETTFWDFHTWTIEHASRQQTQTYTTKSLGRRHSGHHDLRENKEQRQEGTGECPEWGSGWQQGKKTNNNRKETMETAELIPKHDHKNSTFKIVYLSRAQLYEHNRKWSVTWYAPQNSCSAALVYFRQDVVVLVNASGVREDSSRAQWDLCGCRNCRTCVRCYHWPRLCLHVQTQNALMDFETVSHFLKINKNTPGNETGSHRWKKQL